MSVLLDIAALLGFVALTAGTALFVAAEFSLTALERSAVDATPTTATDAPGRSSTRTAPCRSSCPAPSSASPSPH